MSRKGFFSMFFGFFIVIFIYSFFRISISEYRIQFLVESEHCFFLNSGLPIEEAEEYMKKEVRRLFSDIGREIEIVEVEEDGISYPEIELMDISSNRNSPERISQGNYVYTYVVPGVIRGRKEFCNSLADEYKKISSYSREELFSLAAYAALYDDAWKLIITFYEGEKVFPRELNKIQNVIEALEKKPFGIYDAFLASEHFFLYCGKMIEAVGFNVFISTVLVSLFFFVLKKMFFYLQVFVSSGDIEFFIFWFKFVPMNFFTRFFTKESMTEYSCVLSEFSEFNRKRKLVEAREKSGKFWSDIVKEYEMIKDENIISSDRLDSLYNTLKASFDRIQAALDQDVVASDLSELSQGVKKLTASYQKELREKQRSVNLPSTQTPVKRGKTNPKKEAIDAIMRHKTMKGVVVDLTKGNFSNTQLQNLLSLLNVANSEFMKKFFAQNNGIIPQLLQSKSSFMTSIKEGNLPKL